MTGRKQYTLLCDQPSHALQLADPTLLPTLTDDGTALRVQTDDRERLPELIRCLTEAGIRLYEVTPLQNKLETLYLTMTH